jgi:PAS domain S-box-containing protein
MNPQLLSKLTEIRNVSLERATTLRARATAREESEQRWMLSALQELDVAHEELRVIEDELHGRSEEMTEAIGAVESERRRYHEIFECAPEPYIVTDSSGIVLEANLLARQLLNIDSRWVIGKPLALYVAGEDRRLLRDVQDILNASGELSSFELHLQPRGAAEPIKTSASVKRTGGERGKGASLLWILQERWNSGAMKSKFPFQIQDRQGQPAALEQLESALMTAVSAWNGAERELERRNEQLAFVAHELRSPLNTTSGWLEILNQEDSGVASRQHVLGVLSRNVQTLARMVEELVDQTRVTQGLIVLKCEELDFRALLERVCDDARGMAHAKRLKFTSEIDGAIQSARCDAYRVQQALTNVLGNAIKFSSGSGGLVQFTAAVDGDTIECRVRDSGPGIAPEHLDSIFQPFIRVNPHGATSGLGLGLHIARRLIELHDGSIHAESSGLGAGALFRIRLPLAGPAKRTG